MYAIHQASTRTEWRPLPQRSLYHDIDKTDLVRPKLSLVDSVRCERTSFLSVLTRYTATQLIFVAKLTG